MTTHSFAPVWGKNYKKLRFIPAVILFAALIYFGTYLFTASGVPAEISPYMLTNWTMDYKPNDKKLSDAYGLPDEDFFSATFPLRKLLTEIIENDLGVKMIPKKEVVSESVAIWNESMCTYNEKYFNEVECQRHVDIRYYDDDLLYDQKFRLDTFRDMLEAWADFLVQNDVPAWMSHGTLLGWFWNKKILPWTHNVNFQMLIQSLDELASRYNNTLFRGRYLIDVNPMFKCRGNQHTVDNNKIDARFIDVENGMYVEITSLSRSKAVDRKEAISCKSPHYYNLEDLFPLHLTDFEGHKFFRPNKILKLLASEYKEKSMTATEFIPNDYYEGCKFSKDKKEWLCDLSPLIDTKYNICIIYNI